MPIKSINQESKQIKKKERIKKGREEDRKKRECTEK